MNIPSSISNGRIKSVSTLSELERNQGLTASDQTDGALLDGIEYVVDRAVVLACRPCARLGARWQSSPSDLFFARQESAAPCAPRM